MSLIIILSDIYGQYKKNVQKMRQAVRKRKTTEDKAKAKIFEKVKPLLNLLREAGKI